jgi:octaprenyl-diphosphate synthase
MAGHLLFAGGKRLRPLLTLLCGRALGVDNEGLYTLGAAIEMLHTATLLHDDILDNASLRRGKMAAHTIFGPAKTVLAGDAMLAKAMLLVSAFGDTRLTDCVSEAVMRTAEGEIAEFDILRDLGASHDDYLAVITGKTAWMLRASCELGALHAGAGAQLVRAAAAFGLDLGIAFQIVDDVLDFSPSSETGKPQGGDVREGKVTPPLLFYAASLEPEKAALFLTAFENDALSEEQTEKLCREVYEQGHAARALATAELHLDRAALSLSLFPESPQRVVLRQMLGYIRNRRH